MKEGEFNNNLPLNWSLLKSSKRKTKREQQQQTSLFPRKKSGAGNLGGFFFGFWFHLRLRSRLLLLQRQQQQQNTFVCLLLLNSLPDTRMQASYSITHPSTSCWLLMEKQLNINKQSPGRSTIPRRLNWHSFQRSRNTRITKPPSPSDYVWKYWLL